MARTPAMGTRSATMARCRLITTHVIINTQWRP